MDYYYMWTMPRGLIEYETFETFWIRWILIGIAAPSSSGAWQCNPSLRHPLPWWGVSCSFSHSLLL